jgi:hypothetical protein
VRPYARRVLSPFLAKMYDVPMRFIVACFMFLLPIAAQEKGLEKQDSAKRPAPAPSNLKVLKLSTGAEVTQVMRTFTAALGVQCTYCHVQGNYPSDENPKKEVARHMIEMAQKVNANFPDGKMHVTCYTCHRGEAEPKTAPEPKAAGQ